MNVFCVSADNKPLDICTEIRARKLLDSGRATIIRYVPFVIMLKDTWSFTCKTTAYRLKIDPGSKYAGLSILREDNGEVVWAAEILHRGSVIGKAMTSRKGVRRSRRQRHTRYRPARWRYRVRPEGWLAPSTLHRPLTVNTWVRRLMKWCPITAISVESNKFDMQLIENPDIQGIEYQQGELYQKNLREYLLDKFDRKCAYCGKEGNENNGLEIEHMNPKSRGGSDSIKNLALACRNCNIQKGNMTVTEYYDFLKNKTKNVDKLKEFNLNEKTLSENLQHAAATNTIRKKLVELLKQYQLPVECSDGTVTKMNRKKLELPKEHWIDSACVGWKRLPDVESMKKIKPLYINCVGQGSRQLCSVYGPYKKDENGIDIIPEAKKGFPCVAPGFPSSNNKSIGRDNYFGFLSGDLVKARHKKFGIVICFITVNASGAFKMTLLNKSKQKKLCQQNNTASISINYKDIIKILQKSDGYRYHFGDSEQQE